MNTSTQAIVHAPSQATGQRTTGKVLKDIMKTYPRRLSITGALVISENALDLFYPVFAGIALDAVLQGNLSRAFSMVAVILGFWLLGALRRAVDTRIYTKIYADLAGKVVLSERRRGLSGPSTVVRAGMARQFVDFFEIQVPALITALVSIVGAVGMLLILEPFIGLLAAIALIFSVVGALIFMKRSEFLAQCLHDRQEQEPEVITKGTPLLIKRHFRVLGGRRVQLSDLEAKAYVGVGFIAAALFAALFVHLGMQGDATAGHLYMLMSYIWTFVFSLDDMPVHIQQIGRLRELGTRIVPDPEGDDQSVRGAAT